MTTTPPKGQNSSADRTMTDFKNGLGKSIPADAFENDSAPGEPRLSEGGKKAFDEETAAIKAAVEKPLRHS